VADNRAQAEYWNSPITEPWVRLQERLDAFFAPLAEAGIAAAQPASGEHALDIGCGCGATVLALAQRVGTGGHVNGVDISSQMLERARSRVAEARLSNVTLTLADASTYPVPTASLDLVFSRLGVMFFADPVAAFKHIHVGLKSSGRMVFVCIRSPGENPFTMTAVQAARSVLPADALPVPSPEDPGMFSFADPARVQRILGAAGFRDIRMTPLDVSFRIPGPAADAAAFSLEFGPLPRVLAGVSQEMRAEVTKAVADAYRRLEGPDGIELSGAFWIVEARR